VKGLALGVGLDEPKPAAVATVVKTEGCLIFLLEVAAPDY
jgi:hypothetical protein